MASQKCKCGGDLYQCPRCGRIGCKSGNCPNQVLQANVCKFCGKIYNGPSLKK